MGTLYDVLGVAPDASPAAIRAAYRRAAREHHPDRQGEHDRMAAVNEAWRVLGDHRRRGEYDRSLGHPPPATSDRTGTAWDEPRSAEPRVNPLARYQDPPRFPWRFMGVMAALGIVVVMLGVFTAGDPVPPTVDNVLHPGDCVVIEPNGDAAERLCTEPHDGVVELFLAGEGACPDGTEIHRDRQGLGQACIRLG